MSNKITNPFLKQLISGISQKATEGRINNISWSTLSEAKSYLKTEAGEKDAKAPADDILGDTSAKNAPAQPETGGTEDPAATGGDAAADPLAGAADGGAAAATGEDAEADPLAGDAGAEAEAEAGGDEDPAQAQADAVKAKAELEKAKAEKDQAEEELENQSYIKLKSSSGTQFLLSKILNQAFRTNTIDALASEMVQKLNIKTKDDVSAFSQDVAAFKVLPGMPQLITSMGTMAEKQPAQASPEQGTE